MNDSINTGYVNSTIENGICNINFYHPKSNSLPSALLTQLQQAISHAGSNEACKVIILSSGGDGTFCAGASFNELCEIETVEVGQQFFSGFAKVLLAMRNCPKFIIGRIHGKCVGGGVGIAAGVDYAIATTKSAIKLSELSIGIGPFVIGPAVIRKIGITAFSQLSLQATAWQTANWAAQKGLFTQVYETAEEMDTAIQILAEDLALRSPHAMELIKNMLWKGTEDWELQLAVNAATSAQLLLEPAAQETIKKLTT